MQIIRKAEHIYVPLKQLVFCLERGAACNEWPTSKTGSACAWKCKITTGGVQKHPKQLTHLSSGCKTSPELYRSIKALLCKACPNTNMMSNGAKRSKCPKSESKWVQRPLQAHLKTSSEMDFGEFHQPANLKCHFLVIVSV